MKILIIFLSTAMIGDPAWSLAIPTMNTRPHPAMAEQALVPALRSFLHPFYSRLRRPLPKTSPSDRTDDRLRKPVQDFIRSATGMEMTVEQNALFDEFLKAPHFDDHSPALIARMNYGKAVYKWMWGQRLIPFTLTPSRSPNWGKLIGAAVDRPTFQQLFETQWPPHAPWPVQGERTLWRLMFAFIAELDPSLESARRVSAPYIDPYIELVRHGPTQPRKRINPVLVRFAVTRLSAMINLYTPGNTQMISWLMKNFEGAYVNLDETRTSFMSLGADRLRAFIGDTIQDLHLSREINRQQRFLSLNNPDEVRSSLQSAEGQNAIVDSLFIELSGWTLLPRAVRSKSTFFEDVLYLIYGFYADQKHPNPLEATNHTMLAMYRTHASIQKNLPHATHLLIRNWGGESDSGVGPDDSLIARRVQLVLKRYRAQEDEILVLIQRASTRSDYDLLIARISTLIDRMSVRLPAPIRAPAVHRIVELAATLAAHNGDEVSHRILGKTWFAFYVNAMNALFQNVGHVPLLMMTAKIDSAQWTQSTLWAPVLEALSDAVLIQIMNWEIHFWDHRYEQTDIRAFLSTDVIRLRPHLAPKLVRMLGRLIHHHQAGHHHDRPSWLVKLRKAA